MTFYNNLQNEDHETNNLLYILQTQHRLGLPGSAIDEQIGSDRSEVTNIS
jgi:hypothetical protein